MTKRTVAFGPFELEVQSATLRRDGRIVKLPPQPAQLLVLLAESADVVVTREEIRARLWPDGTVVHYDQSINFRIRRSPGL